MHYFAIVGQGHALPLVAGDGDRPAPASGCAAPALRRSYQRIPNVTGTMVVAVGRVYM